MSIQTFNVSQGTSPLVQEVLKECSKVSLEARLPDFSFGLSKDNPLNKMLHTQHCKPFRKDGLNKFRQQAKKFMLQIGVSFDRGYLINNSDIPEVIQTLNEIGMKFNAEIDATLIEFEKAVMELADEYRQDGHLNEAALLLSAFHKRGIHGFRNAISWRFSIYEISQSNAVGEHDLLEQDCAGLEAQLCHEVARLVEEHKFNPNAKKVEISAQRKFVEVLKKKVSGLAFLNPNILGIKSDIDRLILPMVRQTKLSETEKYALGGFYAKMQRLEDLLDGTISLEAEAAIEEANANDDWVKDAIAAETSVEVESVVDEEESAIGLLFGDDDEDESSDDAVAEDPIEAVAEVVEIQQAEVESAPIEVPAVEASQPLPKPKIVAGW